MQYSCLLMLEEQLKAFIAIAKNGQITQDYLKAAKTSEIVEAIAKENVYEFTVDKMTNLSEEELEGVTGGTVI